MRHLWKVKGCHLKMHFAVDVETGQLPSTGVSSEKAGDGRRLTRLMKRAGDSVRARIVQPVCAPDKQSLNNSTALLVLSQKPRARRRRESCPDSFRGRVPLLR